MSYDDLKQELGKQPVYIVELEMNRCPLTYGTGLCTATGGPGEECFNTASTCQLSTTYAGETQTTFTHRFASTRITDEGSDVQVIHPTVLSVQTAPSVLTPGKGLGVRATCTVSLQDHPWTDLDTDPYVANRSYDPDTQGSYWGKLLARNHYYEGRKMTIRTGYLDENGQYDVSNFSERAYFIDSVSGPDKNGKVSIKGKDILKFASNAKAQLPTHSEAVLNTDIDNVVTSIAVTDPSDQIIDAFNDADNGVASRCYVRIDDETMEVTNVTGTSPSYTLTVIRASMPGRYDGTMLAEEHSQDSTVQHCQEYTNKAIHDVLYHLLNSGANIDASFLDYTEWQEAVNFGFTSYIFSTLIVEPTGVSELIKELSQLTLYPYWDERAQLVKVKTILQETVDHGPFDESSHLLKDSIKATKDDKARASQVWLVYGHRNPVLEMDKYNYFSKNSIGGDPPLEGPERYGTKQVLRYWSRWLDTSQEAIADEIVVRLNREYKEVKDMVVFSLAPKDDEVWTGDIITMSTNLIQDEFGGTPTKTYRVLEATEQTKPGKVTYAYKAASIGEGTLTGIRTGLITPDEVSEGVPFPDYSSATDEQKDTYAFIAYDERNPPTDTTPGFPVSDPPYYII